MVPVVLIDGKPIVSDRIIEVRTDRDLNQPDLAVVTLERKGDRVANLGQSMQIDLTSRGGTIFTGNLVGVQPLAYSSGSDRLKLSAKTKTFRIPSTQSPESSFRDAISNVYARYKNDVGEDPFILDLQIDKSIETGQVLYELTWAKEIRYDNHPEVAWDERLPDLDTDPGFCVGFITHVRRRYMQSAGPSLEIELDTEMPRFVPHKGDEDLWKRWEFIYEVGRHKKSL